MPTELKREQPARRRKSRPERSPEPNPDSVRGRILGYLREHPDEDLTHEMIMAALGLTRSQIQQGLWGLRSGHPNLQPSVEMGGHLRPGHVRYWTDSSQRPLRRAKRPAKSSRTNHSTTTNNNNTNHSSGELVSASAEHEPQLQPQLDPFTSAAEWFSHLKNAAHPTPLSERETTATAMATTVHAQTFHAVGQLDDGRVLLAGPGRDVILVAEPYVPLLSGPNQ